MSDAAARLALCAACAGLAVPAGCGSGAAPESARAAVPSQRAVEETAAVTAEEARRAAAATASIGKPQAPVEAAVLGTPDLQSGVPGRVWIEVRPGVAVEGLTVVVTGDAAVAVVGRSEFRYGVLAAGEAVRAELSVMPVSGGIGRLRAVLTLVVGGKEVTRPVSLALPVRGPVFRSEVAGKPEVPPVPDARGELVQSLPAETTVVER